MTAPTGDQYVITAGDYRAVVTESGATLRLLEHAGRPLLDGFAEDQMPTAGRGQLLAPWPNRIQDGAYAFGGRDHQLPLTDAAERNARHGLVRWVAWTLEEHTQNSVSLVYRLMAQSGYPWTVDLHVLHDLSADGLTVSLTATNLSDSPAPYAYGAHPYLVAGPGRLDEWELTLPAATRVLVDDRALPVGREDVGDTPYDFRVARPVRGTVFDHCFTDLIRGEDGRAEVLLQDPATGRGAALWMDTGHRWVHLFSGVGEAARRSLAVEPQSAPANAFRTGEDLVVLAPTGKDGDEHSASWGVRAL